MVSLIGPYRSIPNSSGPVPATVFGRWPPKREVKGLTLPQILGHTDGASHEHGPLNKRSYLGKSNAKDFTATLGQKVLIV